MYQKKEQKYFAFPDKAANPVNMMEPEAYHGDKLMRRSKDIKYLQPVLWLMSLF
jgi:hypothetical protein